MSPDLQQSLTLTIVALAAIAVLWRLAAPWFRGEKSSGCTTGCGSCPANKADVSRTELGQPLVQIQLPVKKHSANESERSAARRG